MALEAVAGALLSSSLQFLFEMIDSREVVAYLRGKSKSRDIDQLVGKLKKVLSTVMAVIEDAEQKQRKSKSVVVWLDMLQDAVFDAEDLLDVIQTESSIETSKTRILFKEKMQKLISQSRSFEAGNLRSKLKDLVKRLEDIAERNDILGLEKSVNIPEKTFWRLPSTSLVDESEVYGRDHDKDEVIKFVLSKDESDHEKTSVISIVGMGGVGKTTLAQIAFNDKRVLEEFDVKAWVCVSEEFDVCRVTKSILEEVTSRSCDDTELNSLQVKLKERLIGKKFLIVLDDVWLEKPAGLNVLFLPFKGGAEGSKIIVTTRSEKVASRVSSDQTLCMNKLSEDSSWKLFAKEASGNKNKEFKLEDELERIGREIVKKCDGLPLALKTLGGLLRSTVDAREWKRIVESNIWDLSEDESDILPALKLSYHYLPSQLKRCFAFCSIFPSDYEFEKEEMISLWMAENLLECPHGNRRIEDAGEDYFNVLVSRSFFQKSNSRESIFLMHDLIHDLAKSVSAEYCLRLEDGILQSQQVKKKKIRHLGYTFRDVDHYERFIDVFEATNLRTFLSVERKYCFRLISKRIVTDLLSKLERLRVLSFFGYHNIESLPDSIGKLRHLRYLDVSCTNISKLPASVCNLFNLQTLKLKSCKRLKNLPKYTHRLVNLKHLDLRDCDSLVEMPKQLSELKKLQTLSTFIVGKYNGTKIGELKELSDLRGKLYLKNLENVEVGLMNDVSKLLQMKRLDSVSFEWKDDHNDDRQHARKVLEMLEPNGNLTELCINGYTGVEFPNWLGFNNSLDYIVSLRLSKCRNCTSLPPLGQLPYLKVLDISSFDALVVVGPEFYYGDGSSCVISSFQSLEILKFSGMKAWTTWIRSDSKTFLRLTELHICDCRQLSEALPYFLPSLTELRISGCENFAFSLPRIPCVRVLILSACKDIMQLESSINSLESCEYMEFSVCASKVRIPIGSLPATLKYLVIQEWKGLEIEFDRPHVSLEELNVHTCDAFQSLPMDYFPRIKKLTIGASESLESLSMSKCLQAVEHNLASSLTSLHIWGCSSLVQFPYGGLFAPNLTHLRIRNCKKLKSLPEKMPLLVSLKFIIMTDCPELETFQEDSLPSSLTELKIFDCDRFIASRENWGLERLPNLRAFVIRGRNEDLKSFPERGLLPKTIRVLEISGFPRLTVLDKNEFRILTSLEKLGLNGLPKLQAIPGEVMSVSLKYLSIFGCDELQRVSGEDLPTTLEGLSIHSCRNCQIVLENGLPVSLKSFVIDSCDELKSIRLDGLAGSLKRLIIRSCHGLHSMSVRIYLTELEITNCRKLKTMPAKYFPNCLQRLSIDQCPLLAKKCVPENGEYWNYIALIPHISIDGDSFVS